MLHFSLLLDKDENACKLSKEFSIPKNSVSTWAKPENKQDIGNEFESEAVNVQRKKLKEGKYSYIGHILLQWVKDVKIQHTPVLLDGKTLKAKVERLVFQKEFNPYNAQTYFQYEPILPSSDLMVLNCTVCYCQHLL